MTSQTGMFETEQEAPDQFNRMPCFTENVEDYLISDIKGVDFYTLDDPPFRVLYMYKKNWAIFQVYVNDSLVFPMTAEAAIVRTVGPSMLPFYLDWTFEAHSWFLAVNMSDNSLMMTRSKIDSISGMLVDVLKNEPASPDSAIQFHCAMMSRSKEMHRARMIAHQQRNSNNRMKRGGVR